MENLVRKYVCQQAKLGTYLPRPLTPSNIHHLYVGDRTYFCTHLFRGGIHCLLVCFRHLGESYAALAFRNVEIIEFVSLIAPEHWFDDEDRTLFDGYWFPERREFYAKDLLWLSGTDLRKVGLADRRQLLESENATRTEEILRACKQSPDTKANAKFQVLACSQFPRFPPTPPKESGLESLGLILSPTEHRFFEQGAGRQGEEKIKLGGDLAEEYKFSTRLHGRHPFMFTVLHRPDDWELDQVPPGESVCWALSAASGARIRPRPDRGSLQNTERMCAAIREAQSSGISTRTLGRIADLGARALSKQLTLEDAREFVSLVPNLLKLVSQ